MRTQAPRGAMDDSLLYSRALSGDLDSFGQLYDRYVGDVFDLAWRTLRDEAAAADVTAGVFARAAAAPQTLARAGNIRTHFLQQAYTAAIARASASAPADATPAPEEAFGAFDVPDPLQLRDEAVTGGDEELPQLVWEAASSLNPQDYAMLDLHLRQKLNAAAIGAVAGMSARSATTLTGRLERAADEMMRSYALARRGECDGLRSALSGRTLPPFDAEAQAAVDAHVAQDERCRAERAAFASPVAVFAALAPVSMPFASKGEVWRRVAAAWHGGSTSDAPPALPPNPYGAVPVAAGPGMLATADDGDFGPVEPRQVRLDSEDDNPLRNRLLLFGGALLGLLIFAFAGGAIIAGGFGGGDDDGEGASDTPDAGSVVAVTPGLVVETSTPADTATITPTEAPTETPSPEPTLEPLPDTPTPLPEPPTFTPVPEPATPIPQPPTPIPSPVGVATPTPPIIGPLPTPE